MRSIELFAAVLAASLGWVGIGLLLLEPSFGSATVSLDPSGEAATTASSSSLLEAGVPAALVARLAGVAAALAVLVAGALLHARGARWGPGIVLAAAVVVVAIVLADGTTAPFLLPGAGVAILAAAIATAPPATRRA